MIDCRNIKSISKADFEKDLLDSSLFKNTPEEVDELVDLYNSTLASLLDKYAPCKSKVVRVKSHAPWYTDEIAALKGKRRVAERRWRKTRLEIHRQIFCQTRSDVNNKLRHVKTKYYNNQILSNSANSKALFTHLFDLLGQRMSSPLPAADDYTTLANDFASFFKGKIDKIRDDLIKAVQNDTTYTSQHTSSPSAPSLCFFKPYTEDQVLKIIKDSKPTSCELDPVPTKFLLDYVSVLLPVITCIINKSLEFGVVPQSLKEAVVKPLLKKPHLEVSSLSNYRPVSNLSFLSKILEKAVKSQLMDHLNHHDLMDEFQSAYRVGHSTETGLLRVTNDIQMSVDAGSISLLVLLDLSAAFDTINHDRLLVCLKHDFGLDGIILNWFDSYLTNRLQSVLVDKVKSDKIQLSCGVPQGSVLGPVLFVMYTKNLGQLIDNHGLGRHSYADDTQLTANYSISKTVPSRNFSDIKSCTRDIKDWMTRNMLKLNDTKTECIFFGPNTRLKSLGSNGVVVGDAIIAPSDTVKNLGVLLEPNLSMDNHIREICRKCYFQLRNISHIRHLISQEAAATLVCCLVFSRIDYCNSLLAETSCANIKKLQLVQNTAARIVTRATKYSHITPVLKSLHWLPINERIIFKVLSLTYQCVNGLAPKYLSNLMQIHVPSRSLRSNRLQQLCCPRWKLKSFGYRSFSVNAPKLWNNLPEIIKSSPTVSCFKSRLKTYLFEKCYHD
ncbi:hypothetical protein SNE40_014357 [Patella caerulea]|uniref:Reverse transcriptase domain-containing protein n=1 Tax=Patella caerulea TaxID=87958 RepID=A0AAN8JI17_PATCE